MENSCGNKYENPYLILVSLVDDAIQVAIVKIMEFILDTFYVDYNINIYQVESEGNKRNYSIELYCRYTETSTNITL